MASSHSSRISEWMSDIPDFSDQASVNRSESNDGNVKKNSTMVRSVSPQPNDGNHLRQSPMATRNNDSRNSHQAHMTEYNNGKAIYVEVIHTLPKSRTPTDSLQNSTHQSTTHQTTTKTTTSTTSRLAHLHPAPNPNSRPSGFQPERDTDQQQQMRALLNLVVVILGVYIVLRLLGVNV